MTDTLKGKAALVTGAARGIGRATALALAREGARIAVADLSAALAESDTVSAIAAAGGDAFAVATDVSDEAQVLALFDEAMPRLGRLDILVNDAGLMLERPLLETSMAEYDRVMGVNLRGTFLVGREGLRHMTRQGAGGRVINVSSDLGYLGRGTFSVYSASKGGVLALTRAWAREFGPDILVNAIAPGPIDTYMLDVEAMSPEWRKKEEDIPLARVGQPEEVAAVALFLAGPGASYMTGQCLGPNGGSVMP
jgi:3-oxoacyl-[acyl-carrier protein] reductase